MNESCLVPSVYNAQLAFSITFSLFPFPFRDYPLCLPIFTWDVASAVLDSFTRACNRVASRRKPPVFGVSKPTVAPSNLSYARQHCGSSYFPLVIGRRLA